MAISESKKKIVIDNYFKRECDVNTSIKEAFIKGFELGVKKAPIPSAESYKGMTNGDMIKAMFPKREVIEHDTYIEVAWGEGMDEFDKGWWNAPYQKEVSDETDRVYGRTI